MTNVENTRIGTVQILSPDHWLHSVLDNNEDGNIKIETLTTEQRVQECLIMGLRIYEEIDEERIMYHSKGRKISEMLDMEKVQHLVDEGFIQYIYGNLKITEKGLSVLDSILYYIQ